jgi:HD-like signal output (HDOD) protein
MSCVAMQDALKGFARWPNRGSMLAWLRSIVSPRPRPVAAARPTLRKAVEAQNDWWTALAPPSITPKPPEVPAEALDMAAWQVLEHFRRYPATPESFPRNATQLLKVLQEPEPDFNRLVQLAGQDQAVAGRLLQLANSAMYGAPGEIQNVRGAVLRLGIEEVVQISLGIVGRPLFTGDSRAVGPAFAKRWEGVFHVSMTAAFTAGAVAIAARAGQPDCAFLAGMFHDIGKSVGLRSIAALHAAGELDPLVAAHGVEAVLERVHVEIGSSATEAWGLPQYLRDATRRHHDAHVPAQGDLAELHIIRLVDGLQSARAGTLDDTGRTAVRTSAIALSLGSARLRSVATEHQELAARASKIFGVADPTVRT